MSGTFCQQFAHKLCREECGEGANFGAKSQVKVRSSGAGTMGDRGRVIGPSTGSGVEPFAARLGALEKPCCACVPKHCQCQCAKGLSCTAHAQCLFRPYLHSRPSVELAGSVNLPDDRRQVEATPGNWRLKTDVAKLQNPQQAFLSVNGTLFDWQAAGFKSKGLAGSA